MKVAAFVFCLFSITISLIGFCAEMQGECTRPGQQCFRPLACGSSLCPFGESVKGVCSANLECIAEGDPCTLPNRDPGYTSVIRGVYKKDGNDTLYCARIAQ